MPSWRSSPTTSTTSASRWSPASAPIPTSTTSSGTPASATCPAATAACTQVATDNREQAQAGAAEEAPGAPLELVALVTPLPDDGGPLPGEPIEHRAHAIGHAAILLTDRRVLLAADMLSDILIPLFDGRQDDQLTAYEEALDLLAEAIAQVDVVVPGHGSPATAAEASARLAADRAYITTLRRGESPADPRLVTHEWLAGPHQGNLKQIQAR